jgi:hypothetical protein
VRSGVQLTARAGALLLALAALAPITGAPAPVIASMLVVGAGLSFAQRLPTRAARIAKRRRPALDAFGNPEQPRSHGSP